MVFRRSSLAILAAALLVGCSGPIDPSKNQTENFDGDLTVGGVFARSFSWSKNGEVETTVTSVNPTPTNGPVAMYIGIPDAAGNCLQLAGYFPQQAIVNRTVPFGVLNKGTYCLAVYDPGVLTRSTHVTGTFSHP